LPAKSRGTPQSSVSLRELLPESPRELLPELLRELLPESLQELRSRSRSAPSRRHSFLSKRKYTPIEPLLRFSCMP
jgi:hypothetical protein